ncbi:peptide-binding protein [Desulfosarcina alkanivorans]|uniref:Peptide-binding protein n=1 Tax=Desulfosarcina alkanivorans TaxID=571177 RepID=A0A5K7YVI6_9BACT|nr:ABC transporter substrate-binding protein [Desulfosarcina alkanivorans]BBO72049.1 peptide-binding protein [Desulfosarcina alkanivorans]
MGGWQRWHHLVALFLAAVALAACSEPSRPDALRIGLAEEPRTLNIWLASDANSRKVLSLIYQPLYTNDPETLDLVPWLADGMPVYDPQGLSYTVTLRNARWSDGSPFTSRDVAFTGELIRSFKVPRYASKWRFIRRIDTPDARTVVFYLKKPTATFLTGTLATPIVQAKEWAAAAETAQTTEKPLASLINHRIRQPVGTGPFTLEQWRQGAFLHLKRNPHFFGTGLTISGRTLGPFVDNLIYTVFGTSDVAILALKKGSIDMFWWPIQPGYMADLDRQREIRLFTNEKSALYFMGFNLRRPPFDDATLRRAVAHLIDKDFIVSRILQGHGTKMFSVVPAENRFWYATDLPRYGDGMSRESRVKIAYRLLAEAGYTWRVPPVDAAGRLQAASEIRLPGGQPMKRFTILTPPADYDPHRATSGLMIQEWLRELGMPAYARPMAFSSLLQQVKGNHDFDAFILGYGRLRLDPGYVRNLFHSANDKARGWNMSGYHNPAFDDVADRSTAEMDPVKRQALVVEMQKQIAADLPYIPIYKPSVVEAVRSDRFEGWVEMLEGIGNIWSMCQVTPVDNDGT